MYVIFYSNTNKFIIYQIQNKIKVKQNMNINSIR